MWIARCKMFVLFGVTFLILSGTLFTAQDLFSTRLPKGSHESLVVIRPNLLNRSEGRKNLSMRANVAIVTGDPQVSGPFVLQLKFPSGYTVPPRVHPADEYVTVISGTFNIGMGDVFDVTSAETSLPAGSFIKIPANTPHFAWASSETIIQLESVGPREIDAFMPLESMISRQ